MDYRIEHDSMGEIKVPSDRLWGAQTQRSLQNFDIGRGIETMPSEIVRSFGILKKAAAMANRELVPQRMTQEKLDAISKACDEVISLSLLDHFPLVVWQTGSGTQSNMNANEVIANRGNQIAGSKLLHPNDDVNMSQSSNDTFPTAMHIAASTAVEDRLIPAAQVLIKTFLRLEEENRGVVKSGRTHLQDATPITFSQEISGWRSSLERDVELLKAAVRPLHELALGGTAVGTGLNAPKFFGDAVAKEVSRLTGKDFVSAPNKFHALTSKLNRHAEKHPVTWRKVESYSALEKLLQNPFDYFMNYTLQFIDTNETSINIFLTYGNVAHKVVETLFTADKNGVSLTDYVNEHYEKELNRALIQKGAILLLPEHHLDRERLRYRFRSCVSKLATIIQENNLTVIQCEQKEEHDLNFEGGIILQGYIDMLLRDSEGNDVVFDLKYVSKKNKFIPVLENNRALQLAIYKAMLLDHDQPPKAVRTAYFVMPYGILFSTDHFLGENCELITPNIQAELMPQLRNGYAERVKEISEGRIETAGNMPIKDIPYAKTENVYPLDAEGIREPKKAENMYSVYKSFTI